MYETLTWIMADFQESTIADLKYRFKDLGAQTAAFRVLTKFENMNDKEIEGCLNTLIESYDMDPISLVTKFENWMDIYEDENFNYSIEALEYFHQLSLGSNDYTLVHELYFILVVLPYSTAECDRGCSTMNGIKNDTRDRLGDILVDLMFIAIYGDSFEFDYDTLGAYVAKEIWKYKKP